MRKRIFVAAGYNSTYFGSGRKEFDPTKPMPPFESYLLETAKGTRDQMPNPVFDEGVIGSFMSGQFIKQGNLPGFLPFMIPELLGSPCVAVEGACGTGGRAIAVALRSVLSDLADVVFVSAFEMQNSMKAVYVADVLAGASYYSKERKEGHAYFFPAIFDARAGAYFERFGKELPRRAMAKWYEQAILNARKNPKAQEFHNKTEDLLSLGMSAPNPETFLPNLNPYDCSRITDGASSLIVCSEEGLKKCGIPIEAAIEIIALGEAEGDITKPPEDLTRFDTTEKASKKALSQAGIKLDEIGILELHDCFTITALLALEAIGLAPHGQAPTFVLDSHIPINLSGGLGGFGHPTGASGVRQMVDLLQQLTGIAPNQAIIKKPHGLMVSMGGNDKTVTCFIVKKTGL